ncbi:hypothetical protein MMIC_P0306 [Mariprofundus micogutta]|uniref:EfeO-type cupredoxin-like domain-containing protein n=1 Tax=Mariprofundus micogutta TaxID=1921010 RepID=A0A1L8CKD8_9PROT|nr:hypothetical protein [Mariprofundus micogutta]GAV19372.1 hypothetical protein MMIC_P0306 [Mariprofundus micogutta]
MDRYIISTLVFVVLPFATTAESAELIHMTQTACQIIEAEPEPVQYSAHSADACVQVNERTGTQRLASAKPLRLQSGEYIFRVSNRDVPYELGFWLRGSGLSRLKLPSVSGGGLQTGESKDYIVSLEPGEYRYSCPLNPTPDYVLLVE